jgi:hypothetical protein
LHRSVRDIKPATLILAKKILAKKIWKKFLRIGQTDRHEQRQTPLPAPPRPGEELLSRAPVGSLVRRYSGAVGWIDPDESIRRQT